LTLKLNDDVILSKYNRKYKINEDEHLLLNLFSGAIDVVDKDVIDVIDHVKQYSQLPTQFNRENPIVSLLFKRGYFLKNLEEEKKIKEIGQKAMQNLYMPGLLLLLTYNCNFRCPYCYEQTLRSKPNDFREKVLSETQVDAAFYFFDDMLENSNRSKESAFKQRQIVTLYGGEPFLPQTMNIVDKIGSKVKERKWVLNAITNGYNLEEFLPIIRKYEYSHLQVTLDGPKKIHDRRRFLQGKKPTFEKIVNGIDQVLDEKQEIRIGVRMNIDPNNLSDLPEFLNFCKKKDWMQPKSRVSISLSSITPSLNSKNYCSYTSDIEFLRDIYNLLGDTALFTQILQYYLVLFLPNPIQEGYSKVDRGMLPHFYNCGANTKQCILDPFGDIYSCWGVVGESSNAIGIYDLSGHEFYESEIKKWRRGVLDIPECSECSFSLICAGGCVYKALTAGKDHSSGYCGQFSEIFEEFVPRHIIARMKEKGSPWFMETE
jgi:uncharacterized protein